MATRSGKLLIADGIGLNERDVLGLRIARHGPPSAPNRPQRKPSASLSCLRNHTDFPPEHYLRGRCRTGSRGPMIDCRGPLLWAASSGIPSIRCISTFIQRHIAQLVECFDRIAAILTRPGFARLLAQLVAQYLAHHVRGSASANTTSCGCLKRASRPSNNALHLRRCHESCQACRRSQPRALRPIWRRRAPPRSPPRRRGIRRSQLPARRDKYFPRRR